MSGYATAKRKLQAKQRREEKDQQLFKITLALAKHGVVPDRLTRSGNVYTFFKRWYGQAYPQCEETVWSEVPGYATVIEKALPGAKVVEHNERWHAGKQWDNEGTTNFVIIFTWQG